MAGKHVNKTRYGKDVVPPWDKGRGLFPEMDDVSMDDYIPIGTEYLFGLEHHVNTTARAFRNAYLQGDIRGVSRCIEAFYQIAHDTIRTRAFFQLFASEHTNSTVASEFSEIYGLRVNTLNYEIEKTLRVLFRGTFNTSLLSDKAQKYLAEFKYRHKHAQRVVFSPEGSQRLIAAIGQNISVNEARHRFKDKQFEYGSDEYNYLLMDATEALNNAINGQLMQSRANGFNDPVAYNFPVTGLDEETLRFIRQGVKKAFAPFLRQYLPFEAERMPLERRQPAMRISWSHARGLLESAFRDFSPRMGRIVRRAFEEEWIDAMIDPDKLEGGMAVVGGLSAEHMPGGQPARNFVSVQFDGSLGKLFELAHELGHAVRDTLAAEASGLNYRSDTMLYETAAIMGEQLLLERLVKTMARDPYALFQVFHAYLYTKQGSLESCINSDFQAEIFRRAKFSDGNYVPFTTEEFGDIYTAVLHSYDPKLRTDKEYHDFWATHVNVHSLYESVPGYDYCYAAAQVASDQIIGLCRGNRENARKWVEICEKGGHISFPEAMAQMGLDVTKSDFYDRAMSAINAEADNLEPYVHAAAASMGIQLIWFTPRTGRADTRNQDPHSGRGA